MAVFMRMSTANLLQDDHLSGLCIITCLQLIEGKCLSPPALLFLSCHSDKLLSLFDCNCQLLDGPTALPDGITSHIINGLKHFPHEEETSSLDRSAEGPKIVLECLVRGVWPVEKVDTLPTVTQLLVVIRASGLYL